MTVNLSSTSSQEQFYPPSQKEPLFGKVSVLINRIINVSKIALITGLAIAALAIFGTSFALAGAAIAGLGVLGFATFALLLDSEPISSSLHFHRVANRS